MNGFKLLKKHTVVDNDDYTCILDEFTRDADGAPQQMLVVHLDFKTFSKSTLHTVVENWEKLRTCIPLPIFAWADVDDAKWERFVRLLGFQYVHTFPPEACTDGKARRVFVSFGKADNAPKEYANVEHGKQPVVGADAVPH